MQAKVRARRSSSNIPASVLDNGPSQIAALAEQVQELKDTVNILISQIQMLRSEVKKYNELS